MGYSENLNSLGVLFLCQSYKVCIDSIPSRYHKWVLTGQISIFSDRLGNLLVLNLLAFSAEVQLLSIFPVKLLVLQITEQVFYFWGLFLGLDNDLRYVGLKRMFMVGRCSLTNLYHPPSLCAMKENDFVHLATTFTKPFKEVEPQRFKIGLPPKLCVFHFSMRIPIDGLFLFFYLFSPKEEIMLQSPTEGTQDKTQTMKKKTIEMMEEDAPSKQKSNTCMLLPGKFQWSLWVAPFAFPYTEYMALYGQ